MIACTAEDVQLGDTIRVSVEDIGMAGLPGYVEATVTDVTYYRGKVVFGIKGTWRTIELDCTTEVVVVDQVV